MRMSRVALVIRFTLLVLLILLAVHIADSPVLADACHDACQNTYNSCTVSATAAYNSCEESVDSALNSCQTWADWDFDNNIEEICGGYTWTACIDFFEDRRIQAYSQCQEYYTENLCFCQNNESGADAVCSSNLANCEDQCP